MKASREELRALADVLWREDEGVAAAAEPLLREHLDEHSVGALAALIAERRRVSISLRLEREIAAGFGALEALRALLPRPESTYPRQVRSYTPDEVAEIRKAQDTREAQALRGEPVEPWPEDLAAAAWNREEASTAFSQWLAELGDHERLDDLLGTLTRALLTAECALDALVKREALEIGRAEARTLEDRDRELTEAVSKLVAGGLGWSLALVRAGEPYGLKRDAVRKALGRTSEGRKLAQGFGRTRRSK